MKVPTTEPVKTHNPLAVREHEGILGDDEVSALGRLFGGGAVRMTRQGTLSMTTRAVPPSLVSRIPRLLCPPMGNQDLWEGPQLASLRPFEIFSSTLWGFDGAVARHFLNVRG
jgi:hypothetical protein